MTEGIDERNDASSPQAGIAPMPPGEHAVPLVLSARRGGALHRDTHYDWMDFHSMPGLSQEW
jgi:hypothetical protein